MILLASCAKHDQSSPIAPGLHSLTGQLQLTGYRVDSLGVFLGTQVVTDASGVPVDLLDGRRVAARTWTVAGRYEFSGLASGAYQTRSSVLGIGDVSNVFVITNSDLVAGDTLRVASRGDIDPVPNPIVTEAFFYFALPDTEQVSVQIRTLAGDMVQSLIDARRPRGLNQTRWNGLDRNDNPVPPGLYWVTLVAGNDQRAQLLFKEDPRVAMLRTRAYRRIPPAARIGPRR